MLSNETTLYRCACRVDSLTMTNSEASITRTGTSNSQMAPCDTAVKAFQDTILGIMGFHYHCEPKRTSGFGCPQEFFRRIGIAKRPEVAPQNRIRDGEVIASKHVEMLVC